MKTTVIYHSADFDGLFCREVARKFLGNKDVEYIGWNFGDPPLKDLPQGPVYILDLPVDRPLGLTNPNWIEQSIEHGQTLIWIDHHKSSIETHPKDIPGYRLDGVAACRLAWQWFNKGRDGYAINTPSTKDPYVERRVSEPLAVQLAGEYDVWDKRDPDAELFQHGLRSLELTESVWNDLLAGDTMRCAERVVELLRNGKVLQFARANEYRGVITSQGFDVEWEGLVFLACNSHEADIRSHLFEAGVKPHHEALLGFTYNGQNKKWQVSMYHVPHRTDLDLSALAARYGGGGHRGAAGMTLKTLPPEFAP